MPLGVDSNTRATATRSKIQCQPARRTGAARSFAVLAAAATLQAAWLSVLGALGTAQAQIYTCTAPDGSRVFSDKKCGADAKPVKGFERAKPKPSPKKNSTKPQPPPPQKTPDELAELLAQCNAGDGKACTTWTLSGGPNALREAEKQAELACEAGSLKDCEARHCQEGATEICRQSVLRTAELSGDTWYLRTSENLPDGRHRYAVRCIFKNGGATRDVAIGCSANPRMRCAADKTSDSFDSLKAAADKYCAVAQ